MMPSLPTTRETIIQAADDLFYGEGIRAASMDAIAERAGVTKRTLYYHFRGKDDLVAAYLVRCFQYNGPIRSGRIVDFVAPTVEDRFAIEVVDKGQQALLEFVFRGDADMPKHRAHQLGKEALDQIERGRMGRREGEGKAARRLRREPSRGLARDMRRMVVEDDLDCRIGRIRGVQELEKLDEFATAMAVFDQRVDVTAQQVDAGHQGHSAMTFVLVIAHHGRAATRQRREIRCRRADRLNCVSLDLT